MVEAGTGGATSSAVYDKGGTWTIVAGQLSVSVPHGLGAVPTKYNISPTNDLAVDCYISSVDAINITITAPVAQIANMTGSWRVA